MESDLSGEEPYSAFSHGTFLYSSVRFDTSIMYGL